MKQFSSVKEALKFAFTGKRQPSCSSNKPCGERPPPDMDITMTMIIPTFSGVTEAEEVDISQYTQDDLERLRLEDPFLYYSIPAMKRQLYGLSDSSIRSTNSSSGSSRRSSCPTILLNNDTPDNDGTQQEQQQRRGSVTRVSRLSVEPHPSVVMENIVNEMMMNDEFNDSDLDEEDEELIQALANGTFDV